MSTQKIFQIAIEGISNIRTVAGLRREATFVQRYTEELMEPHLSSRRQSHVRGFVFGFSQSIPFFAYAAAMYYGGYLIENEGASYDDVFK